MVTVTFNGSVTWMARRPTGVQNPQILDSFPQHSNSAGFRRLVPSLGYLSDPILEKNAANGEKVDPTLLAHPLVWIISFDGLEIPSSGPPGSEHHIAHEYNVVIDATTGAYIMGFVYR